MTPANWIKLGVAAFKGLKANSKIAKLSTVAQKTGKDLKGKNLAKQHLAIFEDAKLAKEEATVKKQEKIYERINQNFNAWSAPDFNKYEKACQKAKVSGNDKLYFKALHVFEDALNNHIDELRNTIEVATKFKPVAEAAVKNHDTMAKACKKLQDGMTTISKVAVVLGPVKTKFDMMMLQTRALTIAHTGCRTECEKLLRNVETLIRDSKEDLRMTKDQEQYVGSQDFEESLN